MKFTISSWAALGASLLVAACGGGGSSGGSLGTQNLNPGRGELMQSPPPRITSLTAADYNARLLATPTGQNLLALSTGSPTGSVPCGVDVQYLKYGTVGGKNEATTASAALMVPTGSDARCTGPRPILLFAHGTNVEKRYNLADFSDSANPAYGQAQLLASMFVAQGYIVVAPNYAGYDSSSLGYHPFLVAAQQSKDMIDALTAAKSALPTLLTPTTASARLFISGYSEGGHVAMATHQALQAAGVVPVTASAPMSGPYAMGLYGDAIVGGQVPAGSTTLMPMVINGYQKSYGTLYAAPSDYYESSYAAGMESAFPGSYTSSTLVSSNIVPALTLFSSTAPTGLASVTPPTTGSASQNALWAAGFGTGNLVKNDVRLAYLTDATINPSTGSNTIAPATPGHPLRQALKLNDFRSWTSGPTRPMLLCGGSGDPTVYYQANTSVMAAIWAPLVSGGLVRVVDVNAAPTVGDGFDTARGGFQAALLKVQTDAAAAATAAGGDATAATTAAGKATLAYYHSGVSPFCSAAARGFFALVP